MTFNTEKSIEELSLKELTAEYNRRAEMLEANDTSLKPVRYKRIKLFKDRSTGIRRLKELENTARDIVVDTVDDVADTVDDTARDTSDEIHVNGWIADAEQHQHQREEIDELRNELALLRGQVDGSVKQLRGRDADAA